MFLPFLPDTQIQIRYPFHFFLWIVLFPYLQHMRHLLFYLFVILSFRNLQLQLMRIPFCLRFTTSFLHVLHFGSSSFSIPCPSLPYILSTASKCYLIAMFVCHLFAAWKLFFFFF